MAAISVIIVVLVSLLVARVGTVALTLTGLSRESARFQARSAFFVEEIDRRAHDEEGDRAHAAAVAAQQQIEAAEEALA